jgi:hypothetical protein
MQPLIALLTVSRGTVSHKPQSSWKPALAPMTAAAFGRSKAVHAALQVTCGDWRLTESK